VLHKNVRPIDESFWQYHLHFVMCDAVSMKTTGL